MIGTGHGEPSGLPGQRVVSALLRRGSEPT
jgi:hypothetical protein